MPAGPVREPVFDPQAERVLGNLAYLGELLRAAGLCVGPDRIALAVEGLATVGVESRERVYYTLRACAVSRREEIPMFDEAFRMFWGLLTRREEAAELAARTLGASVAARRVRRILAGNPSTRQGGQGRQLPIWAPAWPGPEQGAGGSEKQVQAGSRLQTGGYSALEVLRRKDFADYTVEDRERALERIQLLGWQGLRETRRWSLAPRGPRWDLRRGMRRALCGGELWHVPRRARRVELRAGAVLLDVSGSMEAYAWALLALGQALIARGQPVEVFLFGTGLTRVTRILRGRPPEAAIRRAAEEVPDWSGGTRIGEALRLFNRHWLRRLAARGLVVLIVSDGLDRGETSLIAEEMARLQRFAYRVVWLNPLLGTQGYRPLAGGMQAALPYVDTFRSVRTLGDIEALLRWLTTAGRRRPLRRQRQGRRAR